MPWETRPRSLEHGRVAKATGCKRIVTRYRLQNHSKQHVPEGYNKEANSVKGLHGAKLEPPPRPPSRRSAAYSDHSDTTGRAITSTVGWRQCVSAVARFQ